MRTTAIEPVLTLDYPQDREIITSPTYTIRLGASPEAEQVEVSIDGGPWRACRRTNGYFWFDWANYMHGRHEISARARLSNGEIEEIVSRKSRVELP